MRATLAVLAALALAVPAVVAVAAPKAEAQKAAACSAPYLVQYANWEFCWQMDELRVQGLEVNNAKYQGKSVFWKAGVPFSITRYHQGTPGPYKDAFGNAGAAGLPGYGRGALPINAAHCPRWLETGTLLQNGRVCLETSDGPNPRVALWSRFDVYNYRFANGWIFHADGTMEPKVLLGGNLIDLGACSSGATGGSMCKSHFHHVYWRFDFDIDGPTGDSVQQSARAETSNLGQSSLTDSTCTVSTGGPWCTLGVEGMRVRDPALFTKWRALDATSRNEKNHARSFEIVPNGLGPGDGVSSGDMWAFAYKGDSAQIGYEVPTNPLTDAYVTRYASDAERVDGADVVMWYAEHVYHETRDEETPSMMWHTTGPTIKPRNFLGSNNVELTYPGN